MFTCPVCAADNAAPQCPHCGFDSSCDYVHHPTLQSVGTEIHAISHHKALWMAARSTPSIAQSIDTLRKLGWDENVLTEVESILRTSPTKQATSQPQKPDISVPVLQLSSFCGKCGTSNLSDAVYCTGCGKRLQPTVQKPMPPPKPAPAPHYNPLISSTFCKRCGSRVNNGSIYCPACSSRIE